MFIVNPQITKRELGQPILKFKKVKDVLFDEANRRTREVFRLAAGDQHHVRALAASRNAVLGDVRHVGGDPVGCIKIKQRSFLKAEQLDEQCVGFG